MAQPPRIAMPVLAAGVQSSESMRYYTTGRRLTADDIELVRASPHRGLVVEGGAARAVAQVGAIRALVEAGLAPTDTWATSAGALATVLAFTDHELAPRFVRDGIADGKAIALRRLPMRKVFDVAHVIDRFAALEIPWHHMQVRLHVSLTDATTGDTVWVRLDKLPIAERLQVLAAGITLPVLAGLPLSYGGRTFVDGGPASLDCDTIAAAGIETCFVLMTHPPEFRRKPLSILGRAGLRFGGLAPACRTRFARRHVADNRARDRIFSDGAGLPRFFGIVPGPDEPAVSRYCSDPEVLMSSIDAAHGRVRDVLRDVPPR